MIPNVWDLVMIAAVFLLIGASWVCSLSRDAKIRARIAAERRAGVES